MGNEIITCAVVGATGRMGRRICEIISAAENYRLAGATERTGHPQIGKTLQEVLGTVKSETRLSGSLEDIAAAFDVIIDFTFPAVSLQTVQFARREKKPAVIGSTGFSAEEMERNTRAEQRVSLRVCAEHEHGRESALFAGAAGGADFRR